MNTHQWPCLLNSTEVSRSNTKAQLSFNSFVSASRMLNLSDEQKASAFQIHMTDPAEAFINQFKLNCRKAITELLNPAPIRWVDFVRAFANKYLSVDASIPYITLYQKFLPPIEENWTEMIQRFRKIAEMAFPDLSDEHYLQHLSYISGSAPNPGFIRCQILNSRTMDELEQDLVKYDRSISPKPNPIFDHPPSSQMLVPWYSGQRPPDTTGRGVNPIIQYRCRVFRLLNLCNLRPRQGSRSLPKQIGHQIYRQQKTTCSMFAAWTVGTSATYTEIANESPAFRLTTAQSRRIIQNWRTKSRNAQTFCQRQLKIKISSKPSSHFKTTSMRKPISPQRKSPETFLKSLTKNVTN